jgi:hypothetical protein
MTAFLLEPAMRFATRRNIPSWPNYAVPTVIFAIGAIVLWVCSKRFWPGDVEQESSVDLDHLKRIAFSLLGAYYLIDNGAGLATDILASLQKDAFRVPPSFRWTTDVLGALVGLVLVVANSKKAPVPGFDDISA